MAISDHGLMSDFHHCVLTCQRNPARIKQNCDVLVEVAAERDAQQATPFTSTARAMCERTPGDGEMQLGHRQSRAQMRGQCSSVSTLIYFRGSIETNNLK